MLFTADLEGGREKLNHLTVVCFLVYLIIPSVEAVSCFQVFTTTVCLTVLLYLWDSDEPDLCVIVSQYSCILGYLALSCTLFPDY